MKALTVALLTFTTFNTEASIFCHTSRMNKVFEVADQKVTFFSEFDDLAKRELASISSRSRAAGQGMTKIVNFENQKHTIHIDDMNSFSDLNDYIIIKSKSGHEVTYPITCERK